MAVDSIMQSNSLQEAINVSSKYIAQKQYSDPYTYLGNIVQKNLQTGELRVIDRTTEDSTKPTTFDKEQVDIKNSTSQLDKMRGPGGFVNLPDYEKMRANSTLAPKEFDQRFGHFLSPGDQQKVSINKGDSLDSALSKFGL